MESIDGYVFTTYTVSLIFIRIAGLRTPASDSGSGLRVRSISLPSGMEVFSSPHTASAPAGMFTNVTDLGRNSQKVLPRSCLGSLDG